ncbi:hypothetical protein NY08_1298 [Rhodococcus sp. B7740]|nr:hypothetical protein NY08_1298 [Rhodococcus sp. B7740]
MSCRSAVSCRSALSSVTLDRGTDKKFLDTDRQPLTQA